MSGGKKCNQKLKQFVCLLHVMSVPLSWGGGILSPSSYRKKSSSDEVGRLVIVDTKLYRTKDCLDDSCMFQIECDFNEFDIPMVKCC